MKTKITIHAEMDERWVPQFVEMLHRMEYNGAIGHSELLAFFSDGDGSFQPRFTFYGPRSIKLGGDNAQPTTVKFFNEKFPNHEQKMAVFDAS